MGYAKKLCENSKKMSENRQIHVKERGVTRILFYSIFMAVPDFITGFRIKQNQSLLFTLTFSAEKNAFFALFY